MLKLVCLGAMLIPAAFGGLQDIRSIYILPMGSSLDQYLAQRLARDGRYAIVTDPQRADAVLTDHLGEGFERKLDELYPQAPTEGPEARERQEASAPQVRVGGFSRARGTVFLVDRSSRVVLWADFVPPRRGVRDEPDKRARSIVDRLRRDSDKARKHNAAAPRNSAPKQPSADSSGIQ